MLRWRLLLGAALILTLTGLCWLDYRCGQPDSFCRPGMVLLPVAIALAAAAAGEFLWLTAAQSLQPLPWVVYGGNVLIVAASGYSALKLDRPGAAPLTDIGWPLLALLAGSIAAFLGEMRRYQKPGGVTVNLALAVFSLVYIGVEMGTIVQLRVLGGNAAGLVQLAALVAVVKMGDIGAYTVGRLFGRHKLAPTLSPGKTIEGAVGAVLFGTLAAGLVFERLAPAVLPELEIGHVGLPFGWVVYGIVVSLAGLVGDLAESLLKRDLGRKDSSSWMPGFGGILDVLDSLLLAAPVAYACGIAGIAI